jgi:hypothetical protein
MAKYSLIFLISFCISLNTDAQQYKSALGLRYGSISNVGGPAVSYKQFIKENTSIEGIFAFRDPVSIGALYQIHKDINSVQNLSWYYGGGAYVAFSKPDIGIGILGNIGLDYKFEGVPINLSLDFKPEFAIAPKAGIDFNTFGFAIRYTFK